ncbi:hypothetical protein [Nocardia brasiliensis]|uniref:hypothetical protein n=1 Tax=Nocardia brasiliensis TaxID=37326 RepID=UPI0024557D4F|nr:hypothetical protein [Nocardia brasiliensis]
MVEHTELDLLCEMNHELFLRTTFSASLSDIRERNLDLFEVNALSFAFVDAWIVDGFVPVGMSSILPLNSCGESNYLGFGRLKDIEVRGRHIAAPGEWSDAVLIFIVGFLQPARGNLRGGPMAAIFNTVFDHGAHLVGPMRQRHPDRKQVRLLAQTNRANSGMSMLFQRGGVGTGITTGDGYPLQQLVLDLPERIPRRDGAASASFTLFDEIANARSSAGMARVARSISDGLR